MTQELLIESLTLIAIVGQADIASVASSINTVWTLVAAFMVFLMQPGFALLEAGQVRKKNTANVLMKNITDWSLGVIGYFVVGLGIAAVVGGLTSPGAYPLSEAFAYVSEPLLWVNWLHAAVFAMAAATIVSGATAGRIKFKTYAVVAVAIVVVVYPVVQGLTWQGGLLSAEGYLGLLLGVGYLDFAGGTVVHMLGGVAGLTAAYCLGPRADRYDDDGNSTPIPGHSVFLSMLGALILAFGWYGFNVGTQAVALSEAGEFMGATLGRAALITTLGMAGGAVGAMLSTTARLGTPDPVYTANGLLAGLVAITGAAVHVTWWGGLLLGLLAGLALMPVHDFVTRRWKIDDACAVFAVHGAPGALGALLIPLFAVNDAGAWTVLGPAQWAMQIIGVTMIGLWAAGTVWAVLTVNDAVIGNRVDDDDEQAGLDASEHSIRAYPEFATDGGSAARDSGANEGPTPAPDAPAERPGGSSADGGGEEIVWRGQTVKDDGDGGDERVVSLADVARPAFVVDGARQIVGSNAAVASVFGHHDPPCDAGTLPRASDAFVDTMLSLVEDGDIYDRVFETAPVTDDDGGETRYTRWTVTPLATGRSDDRYLVVGREGGTALDRYREAAVDHVAATAEAFADGDVAGAEPPPEPPVEGPTFDAVAAEFRSVTAGIDDAMATVRTIVDELPEQSTELVDAGETIGEVGGDVAAASEEIDDLTEAIADEVASLAADTDEVSELVETQSAQIEQISAQSSEVDGQARAAVDRTETAAEAVHEAVEGIGAAVDGANDTVAEVERLAERMDEVQGLVESIDDIAEQTNMLALNASIEAARAGDDGGGSDGFAVVADEVKSLAEESRERATEIGAIVDDAVAQTSRVSAAIDESTTELEDSAAVLRDTVGEIDDANDEVTEATENVAAIETAIERQAEQAERVASLMDDVREFADRIADQTDAVAEEAGEQAATTEELEDAADSIESLVADVDAALTAFERSTERIRD